MNTAYYATGLSCNLKCVFCPCSEEQPEYKSFSVEELIKTVDETLVAKDIDNFLLSGGEPTIQKNFLPIVDYIANEKKVPLSLLTNAIAFSNKKFFTQFLNTLGNSKFEMVTAVHSHLAEKHDRLTQMNGSFNKTLAGLKNCIDAGINTCVKFNIVNYNYKEIPEFIDFAYRTFPDAVSLILCNIDISGYARKNKDLIPIDFKKSAPYLETALDEVIEYMNAGAERNVRVFTTPLCTLDPYYWHFVNKSTKDDVTAYRSPDADEERNKLLFDFPSGSGTPFEQCTNCDVKEICPGTWESYADYFGADFLFPFTTH
jgi:MoaA/NifB/PqqE/SkfB family radical SAM enzyme